jgi:hypothetical protein
MAKVCDRCGGPRQKDSQLAICDACDAILEIEYGRPAPTSGKIVPGKSRRIKRK